MNEKCVRRPISRFDPETFRFVLPGSPKSKIIAMSGIFLGLSKRDLLDQRILAVAMRADAVLVQIALREMHSENQHRDQTEI